MLAAAHRVGPRLSRALPRRHFHSLLKRQPQRQLYNCNKNNARNYVAGQNKRQGVTCGALTSPRRTYLIYRSVSPQVVVAPDGKGSLYPWIWLTGLTGINIGVFLMWHPNLPRAIAESQNGAETRRTRALSSEKDEAWNEFMMKNFTISVQNVKELRLHTFVTAAFSHQTLDHLFGNMMALWLFGFRSLAALGMPAFMGLYLVGGSACSLAHVLENLARGRTEPALPQEELQRRVDEEFARLERQENDKHLPLFSRKGINSRWKDFKDYSDLQQQPHIKRKTETFEGVADSKKKPLSSAEIKRRAYLTVMKRDIATRDMPSLGASGAVMAITNGAALLHPQDIVRIRIPLPLPIAVLIFTLSDITGVIGPKEGDMVDHFGHLAGALAGLLYVTHRWNASVAQGVVRGPLPIVALLKRLLTATK